MQCPVAIVVILGVFAASLAETVPRDVPKEPYRILSVSSPAKTMSSMQLSDSALQKLKNVKVQPKEEVVVDFNPSADYVVKVVSTEILEKGLDPANTYNHEITFQYRPLLIITYTGTLKLTNGFIQELSTVVKRGDSVITYEVPLVDMNVYIPLGITTVIAGYNFEMNVKGDTVKGVLYAWANDVTADYRGQISLNTMLPVSRSFAMNIGSFEIQIFSDSISNEYRNLVTQLVTDFMRRGVPVERIVPKVRILSVTELEEGLENEVREPSRNNQKAQAKAGIVDLNLWTDGVINTVARGILYGNLDPVLVSGYSIKFDYRPLLITYSGTLTLTQGSIQGLSSITRGGNALMPSDTLITVPLRFSNVILSYNFEMNVRGDTVTGVLYTWLTDPSATYQRYISPTINSYGFNLNIG
ncbi:hypothetical protein Trydic_g13942 [Trypoxylus dichotomus]